MVAGHLCGSAKNIGVARSFIGMAQIDHRAHATLHQRLLVVSEQVHTTCPQELPPARGVAISRAVAVQIPHIVHPRQRQPTPRIQ